MELPDENLKRVLDAAISNKKFYQRLVDFGLDITDVWLKLANRPIPRSEIRLDDFYRDNHGIFHFTVARWWEKYEPQRFKNLQDTIDKLSSLSLSTILTDQEREEINMIKKRICNKYEYDRDLLVRKEYRAVKGKTPRTQAQCDTKALIPLFDDIWRVTEQINYRGLDLEGREEHYYKKDVEELLACLMQARGLMQYFLFFLYQENEDWDEAFKKAVMIWKSSKREREQGSIPPYDSKYVHDRLYPP